MDILREDQITHPTIEDLILWLAHQPETRTFVCGDAERCLLAQWYQEHHQHLLDDPAVQQLSKPELMVEVSDTAVFFTLLSEADPDRGHDTVKMLQMDHSPLLNSIVTEFDALSKTGSPEVGLLLAGIAVLRAENAHRQTGGK